MRRLRIGVHIDEGEIICVAVREKTIVWHERMRSSDEGLPAALEKMAKRIPRLRFERTEAYAVLGPQYSQQRQLVGLPMGVSARIAQKVVKESSTRFFLGNLSGPVVSTPVLLPDKTFTGAVFHSDIVDAVQRCRAFRFRALGASGAVLIHALKPVVTTPLLWKHQTVSVRISMLDSTVVSVQRLTNDNSEVAAPALVDGLDAVGPEFASAYGATVANWRRIPSLSSKELSFANEPQIPLRHLAIASVIASGGVWLSAPALIASRMSSAAQVQSQRLQNDLSKLTEVAAHQQERVAVAEKVNDFRSGNRSMVELLEKITTVLPESTAIATLRVDSLGGTVTLLGPRTMEGMRGLATMKSFEDVRVASPVVREAQGTQELERVTVRFRIRAARLSTPGKRQ